MSSRSYCYHCGEHFPQTHYHECFASAEVNRIIIDNLLDELDRLYDENEKLKRILKGLGLCQKEFM